MKLNRNALILTAAVAVPLAIYLGAVILPMGGGAVSKETAQRHVCLANLTALARQLNTLASQNDITFNIGLEAYLEKISSSHSLQCPSRRTAGASGYMVTSVSTLRELEPLASEGNVVLIRDRTGNHKGGYNYLALRKVDGQLMFLAGWVTDGPSGNQ